MAKIKTEGASQGETIRRKGMRNHMHRASYRGFLTRNVHQRAHRQYQAWGADSMDGPVAPFDSERSR